MSRPFLGVKSYSQIYKPKGLIERKQGAATFIYQNLSAKMTGPLLAVWCISSRNPIWGFTRVRQRTWKAMAPITLRTRPARRLSSNLNQRVNGLPSLPNSEATNENRCCHQNAAANKRKPRLLCAHRSSENRCWTKKRNASLSFTWHHAKASHNIVLCM